MGTYKLNRTFLQSTAALFFLASVASAQLRITTSSVPVATFPLKIQKLKKVP
jgi:hypothetical protein